MTIAGLVIFAASSLAQITTLEGHVIGTDGNPVVGAVIRIHSTDQSWDATVRTDRRGHYIHTGVPVGTLDVSVVIDRKEVGRITGVSSTVGTHPPTDFDLRKSAAVSNSPTAETGQISDESKRQTEQSPATGPPSPGSAKMTNDEVIQLVTAGFSEQVVATSIRQAPAKAFDLSPTGLIALKKAGVSDALIVLMLQSGASALAPKDDAASAERPKPAAAPCSGIESMGVYKNEIFDRAMGGGVVEWLAKIRNNTGVTKIVVVGWRDVNGQQQSAQVQIRGGEIASPRLDLTQARVIPPVTDVRVLSCQ